MRSWHARSQACGTHTGDQPVEYMYLNDLVCHRAPRDRSPTDAVDEYVRMRCMWYRACMADTLGNVGADFVVAVLELALL